MPRLLLTIEYIRKDRQFTEWNTYLWNTLQVHSITDKAIPLSWSRN
jgi:hypothetical protein